MKYDLKHTITHGISTFSACMSIIEEILGHIRLIIFCVGGRYATCPWILIIDYDVVPQGLIHTEIECYKNPDRKLPEVKLSLQSNILTIKGTRVQRCPSNKF